MKKLIRIGQLIYSNKVGGSEILAANISSCLDPAIFSPNVIIYYKSKGTMPVILKEKKIDFTNIGMTRTKRLFGPLIPAFYLKRLKIDILHIHHIPLYLKIKNAAYLARIPCLILTEHAKYSISKSKRLRKACRNTVKYLDNFVTVSKNLKEYFVKIGLPENAIRIIYNGVDTKRYRPINDVSSIREEVKVEDEDNIIVSVGRLTDAKDHKNILKALQIIKTDDLNFKLIIIGDGELREKIEHLTLKLGLKEQVILLGNRTDIDRLLNLAKIFVLHSKREGFPISLLEAMSTGLPIIATNVGGIPEIVKDGFNGVLVEPKRPQQLARAIKKIIKDKKFANKIGQNARKTINESFSLEMTTRKYADTYLETYWNKNK